MRQNKKNQKKIGKAFEEDFAKSVPLEYLIHKYPDSPSMYKKVHNPSDFELMGNVQLHLIECKTVQGNSFPFKNITPEQLYKMCIFCTKVNVTGGYLINFRDYEETYYIKVQDLLSYMTDTQRKSISRQYLMEVAFKVDAIKKRTRYRYDALSLINYIDEKGEL